MLNRRDRRERGDNRNQDDGWCLTGSPSPPFSVSANHFDGEELNAGSALVRRRLDDARARFTQTRADGKGARRLLGQALHGVQDYYAHSNRAESVGTADDRLGVSTFDAVGRSTPTCQAPPYTGTYVGLNGLTSGYWLDAPVRMTASFRPGSATTASRSFQV